MEQPNSIVCIFQTHLEAQRAMTNLQRMGIGTETLSIATKDISLEGHETGDYSVGDQTFIIPGIGPLLVSGPLASWIVTVFEEGADGRGMSIAGAGLATLGVPLDDVLLYEAALKSNKYLFVLHGSTAAVAIAVKVIGGTTHCSHTIHGEKVFDTVHGPTLLASPSFTYQA